MARITINGVTVDPLAKGPALAAAPPRARDASGSDYVLIPTREPLTDAQRADVTRVFVTLGKAIAAYERRSSSGHLALTSLSCDSSKRSCGR